MLLQIDLGASLKWALITLKLFVPYPVHGFLVPFQRAFISGKMNKNQICKVLCTKRQNELYIEIWQLCSQSSTDALALLPCAMLPRQARGTHKKTANKTLGPAVQFSLSLGR